ncbi:MAG: energy transducer TonB [Candidatus Dadabacteria bacterium]
MKKWLLILAFAAIYNCSLGQTEEVLKEESKPREAKATIISNPSPAVASATYKGGDEKWLYYQLTSPVLKNAIRQAKKDKIPEGRYKLLVQFTVLPGGELADIKTVNEPIGYGLEDAAICFIQESGKWIPGKSEGKEVATQMTIPLSFSIKYK